MFNSLQLLPILLLITAIQAATLCAESPANIAVFGQAWLADLQNPSAKKSLTLKSYPLNLRPGQALQFEWTEPRDVRAVQLALSHPPPNITDVQIEWWHRIWPDNGTGGWMKLDDPFNGHWTRSKTTSSVLEIASKRSAGHFFYQFAPLDANEVPGIKKAGSLFRHTYKLRLSARNPCTLDQVSIYTDAVMKHARIRLEWDLQTKVPGRWSPRFEACNGETLTTTKTGKNTAVVELLYSDSTNRLSADRGHIICRSGDLRSFSVFVDDVLREGGLYVRDLGVFVSDADKGLTYASWTGPKGEVWKSTVMEQVSRLPEQSFEQVMQAIPLKPANEIFLGAPALRQEVAVGPKGDIRLYADGLRSPGPDAERRPWKWKNLVYQFSTGKDATPSGAKDTRAVTRQLEDGWLPVVRHDWQQDDLSWVQTCLAAPLLQNMASLNSRTGTEPIVLLTQFDVTNNTDAPRTASLWLTFNNPLPLRLGPQGTLYLLAPSDGTNRTGLTPVRGRFNAQGKGILELSSNAVHYTLPLPPNESHRFELAVPYIELLNPEELVALQSTAFARLHDSVARFWRNRVDRGMTYHVPDKFLNEFFKAHLWHVLISTDIDPVTGHYQHGAATHVYPNFLNETAMVARSLEMRGEHEEAQRLLQPFLDCQGVKGLPGNFKSQNGVFYAAHPTDPDPYTAQGYNMHHGWGLWALAEHYSWTKDDAWLRKIASNLIEGCDWVTRERQATRLKNPDRTRPVEFGLAPAGDLEDVAESLYWYATDAYYYLGMKQAAGALARIKHPQSRRLARDAKAFLQDIQASVAESVASSPVVRLKDGTYVPYIPSRAYALTHLKEGWIREALYPALYLYDGEIYAHDHPYMEWILQDQEDNIFLSKESGYGVADQAANFFNFGGFTLQPNLPNLPPLYLQRDQVPNFLRAFYNICWASLYPDTMCFAEWVPAYGRGGGPLFKTPDESKFIQWMRYMLIMERSQDLELGLGVPRAWMQDGLTVKVERAATFFGRLDLQIDSHVKSGRIEANIRLNKTEAPRSIWLRLRHPEAKTIHSALVNGKTAKINSTRQLIQLPSTDSTWQVTAQF